MKLRFKGLGKSKIIEDFLGKSKIIEDFKALPAKRQTSIASGLAIIVLLVIVSVGASFVQSAYLSASSDSARSEASAPGADEQATGEEQPSGYDALSAQQKVLADSYGESERKTLEFLKSGVWTADGGSSRVEFSDYSFKEVHAGADKESCVPFAIAAVTKSEAQDSGAKIERTSVALSVSSGSQTMEIQQVSDKDGHLSCTLTSDAFSGAHSYVLGAAASSFKLEGAEGGQLSTLVGGDASGLQDALKKYCATSFPTASVATWDKRAMIDYGAHTATFSLALNNEKKTQLSVAYSMDAKTFSINAVR